MCEGHCLHLIVSYHFYEITSYFLLMKRLIQESSIGDMLRWHMWEACNIWRVELEEFWNDIVISIVFNSMKCSERLIISWNWPTYIRVWDLDLFRNFYLMISITIVSGGFNDFAIMSCFSFGFKIRGQPRILFVDLIPLPPFASYVS